MLNIKNMLVLIASKVKTVCSVTPMTTVLYWRSPVSTVFWLMMLCTIRGIALIGDWFSTKTHEIGQFKFQRPLFWFIFFFSLKLQNFKSKLIPKSEFVKIWMKKWQKWINFWPLGKKRYNRKRKLSKCWDNKLCLKPQQK